MSRGCKSVKRPRQCNSIVLERHDSLPLEHGARSSDGTAAQSGRHTQARESQGYAARPREGPHASRREPRRGPGDLDAAKGQPAPQAGFGAQATAIGRRRRGKRSSHAEGPAGEPTKRRGSETRSGIRGFRSLGAESSSGIAIAAPAVHILSCCGLQVKGRVALSWIVGCVGKSLEF